MVCSSDIPERAQPGVSNPGPEEPQGALAFIVTQQLIDQWKQMITQLTHLTWFLWSESIANFKVKAKTSTPCSSPVTGLLTPGLR